MAGGVVRLSADNLRQRIEEDARALGLPVEEAIARARERTLPPGPYADELVLLVELESS